MSILQNGIHPVLNVMLGVLSAWISAPVGSALFAGMTVPSELRAPWTPPGYVFAIVWNIIYLVIARQYRFGPRVVSLSHLVLIHCWTPIFFGLHMYKTSLVVFAVIFYLSTNLMIYQFENGMVTSFAGKVLGRPPNDIGAIRNRTLFWVMVLMWLGFAFSLNIYATYYAGALGFLEGAAIPGAVPTRIESFFNMAITLVN